MAVLTLAGIGVPAPACCAATANHPFGSHPFAYAAGSVLPDHLGQAALDQAARDFYDQWKERYLVSTCGNGRYVVETAVDGDNLTVSEGHGYGMMLAALMAGHDPDAQDIFDGMYAYFREHPTAFHARLMSFYQKRSCADAQGNDSASDGDLDIAFALLLADKQWGSCGRVDYLAEALAMFADLADGDIDPSMRYVLLGDWASSGEPGYFASTRSSDFLPDHYRSFQASSGDPAWAGLVDHTYAIVDALQSTHAPATGLLPDFVVDPLGAPAPAPPFFLESAQDGAYSYNACRDPWRLATDFLVSGDTRARNAVQSINTWVRASTSGDPAAVRSGYELNGSPAPDSDFASAVFVAPLGVGAMVDAANQAWLDDVWDWVTARSLDDEDYYGNTLKLLAMVVMSGNWWAPQSVSGGCTPEIAPLCTSGGESFGVEVKVGGLGKGAGRQKLDLRGALFFPQQTPVGDLSGGAQVRVEDLGAGGATLLDLSTDTNPVPAAIDPACDARDGWKVTAKKVLYKNKSGALDAPACSAGSAEGLTKLQYRIGGARDVDFKIAVRRETITSVVGPLRATLVLGRDSATGDGGGCAVSASLACTELGSKLRCR